MRIIPPLADHDPVETTLRAIEADIHTAGWNQKPIMISLCHGTWLGKTGLGAFPWPVPFDFAPPAQILEWVAGIMVDQPTLRTAFTFGAELVGLAFITEAYQLTVDPNDERAMARAMSLARKRLIHQAPDRIEIRSMTAITTDNRLFELIRRRDETPELIQIPADDPGWTGVIPDSLRMMIRTIGAA